MAFYVPQWFFVQTSEQDGARAEVIEEPQGIPQASVDDKGRLKLPVEFAAYLEAHGGKKLFITSIDKREAQIYPMSVWQNNLNVLRTWTDKKRAQRIQFDAKLNGDAVEIDDNGRVLIPASTRKLLGMSGREPVWLNAFNGRVNLVTKKVLDERGRESDENRAGDLEALEELSDFR